MRKVPAPSVRTRIVAAITIVAAIGLAAVGLSSYLVERGVVLQDVEERLRANLDSARFLVSEGQDATGSWPTSTDALYAVVQRMSPDDNTGAMGIVGDEVAFVPGVPLDVDIESSAAFVRTVVTTGAEGVPTIATFVDGEHTWRYLVAPITVEGSPAPETVLFAMAYDLPAEMTELDETARVFVIAGILAVIAIAAAAQWVSTRLLRPLRAMRETAERVSAQSLSERLPIHGRDDVSELAVTINAMLDRLDAALDSQRRLLGDIGHELKTPITIVQGYLEVLDPNDPEDVSATQALAVDELGRMSRLVQDLAGAASLYGPSPVTLRPTDLADLLVLIARKAEGIVGADVELGPIADLVAEVDPGRITQAMLQLAQNAVTHGGGRMVIGSQVIDQTVVLTVRDFGPGVTPSSRDEIFERFYRSPDAGQARGVRGSGLGLDIVRLIARAHGGEATVADPPGGGAEFRIVLPARVIGPPPVPDQTAAAAAVARRDSGARSPEEPRDESQDEGAARGIHTHR